jgi:hypothetical protein
MFVVLERFLDRGCAPSVFGTSGTEMFSVLSSASSEATMSVWGMEKLRWVLATQMSLPLTEIGTCLRENPAEKSPQS